MSNAVVSPRTTLNIIRRDGSVGSEDIRNLIVAQITANAAADITDGMVVKDLPRTKAELAEILGSDSHAFMVANNYRKINPYTNLDMIVLDDDGSATAATAVITFAGAATKAASLFITVVDEKEFEFEIDIEVGDTPTEALDKLQAVVDARAYKPFTFAHVDPAGTFTAANGGSLANNWPIKVRGRVPGLTYTLTGWTGGATDPDLSTLFDDVQTTRYQGIVWPDAYALSTIKAFIDPRKNVDNDIMDGMAFTYLNEPFVTIKTSSLGVNSSEVCISTNKPMDEADWKGPHLPCAPDAYSAQLCAVEALRVESASVSLSDFMSTNAAGDQFSGPELHTLPLFNTAMPYIGLPKGGSGYSFAEQLELEDAGVSVVGANRSGTGVVLGQMVTTWQKDPAGNDDETWKYVNWRRSHGYAREYLVVNCRKRFAQSRLTAGQLVATRDMATRESVRAYIMQLAGELAEECIVVKGPEARRYIEDNLVVELYPEQRRVAIYAKLPLVSQLGEIIGTVQYSFNTAT